MVVRMAPDQKLACVRSPPGSFSKAQPKIMVRLAMVLWRRTWVMIIRTVRLPMAISFSNR